MKILYVIIPFCSAIKLIAAATNSSAFQGSRQISLRNSCSFPVRVGLTTGAISGTFCSDDTDCPPGGLCSPAANLCFYSSFLPNGYLDLNSNEETKSTVSIDGMYSGALYVSTGCNTYANACETGICRNKHCDAFTGPTGPHSRAEFTFNPSGTDYYDISLMHGVNVPITMQAMGGNREDGDPYSCGAAGSVFAENGLEKCTYSYTGSVNGVDRSADMVFVAAPDLQALQYCSNDSQCSVGLTCGLAAGRDPTGLQTTEVERVCGKPVGLWSADEVCIYSNGGYSADPYNCNKNAKYGPYSDLYGCAGGYSQSGYQADSDVEHVCGCEDWEGLPSSHVCNFQNPEWMSVAYPWANVIKDVCPSAYSYAYDDMTSTFVCSGTDLGYLIEFCPNGVELQRSFSVFNKGN